MNATRGVVVAAVLIAASLIASRAEADGGFFSPWGYNLYEYEQLAFLDWNPASGTETLIIMPGFHGDARDFAWVVPVPAEPEVAPADSRIFRDLFELTSPRYRSRDSSWDCDDEGWDDAAEPANVDVIRHDVIGIYDVMVIQATEGEALTDSLTAWGFLHAGNRSQAEPLLADYVARGWSFVTMTVDSATYVDTYSHGQYGDYVYGGVQPIQLAFAVAQPIYPMRLSSISAAWDTKIVVFAGADHRYEFTGATTTYANRFTDGEYAALVSDYSSLAGLVGQGRFLTRLERTMDPAAMTADLELTRAPNDDEFHRLAFSGFSTFGVFLVASTLAWATWKTKARMRRSPH